MPKKKLNNKTHVCHRCEYEAQRCRRDEGSPQEHCTQFKERERERETDSARGREREPFSYGREEREE